MQKVRVHTISMSLDGFMAGPDQSVDAPLGTGAERLHDWVFATAKGAAMIGQTGGEEGGIDTDFLERGERGVGATILGRNMFGPIRGDWGDEQWKGWWGPNPPYHHPAFVLTHHPRSPLEMEGGTTFYFVTDGIESALEQALAAADGGDVRIGGGASTIQQYLRAGLVDEIGVAIAPVLLGKGERLFDNLGVTPEMPWGYECVELISSAAVTHARFEKVAQLDT